MLSPKEIIGKVVQRLETRPKENGPPLGRLFPRSLCVALFIVCSCNLASAAQVLPGETAVPVDATKLAAVATKEHGGAARASLAQTPEQHGIDDTSSLEPLVLSPANRPALYRFRALFASGLAHPVALMGAARAAEDGQINTIIFDPAHPFTFAMVTKSGSVISTTRRGPDMPAAFIQSGANVVVLPMPRGPFAFFNVRFFQLLANILFVVSMMILAAFGFMMLRRHSMKRHPVRPQDTGDTTFSQIAGQNHAKMELFEVVELLRNPHRFAGYGIKQPRGVLLIGPPGNGKTMLAKAVAKESGVRFFAMSGSDFVEFFVGVGAARVRGLFKSARGQRFLDRLLRRKPQPAVIFIDEIDAVGGKRGRSLAGNDERESTLNQILVEMDGIASDAANGQAPVVVIAATNRVDMLDEALLRRFPQKVDVMPPDMQARVDILRVHTKGMPKESVDFVEIARMTAGFSGANLASLAQEAARIAQRDKSRKVTQEHFGRARHRVILGAPRPHILRNEAQRRIIAVHEAGHALARVCFDYADEIGEASIIPHGEALGHVSGMPPEDEVVLSRARIEANLRVMMAGRAAEEEVFGKDMATTGASQDRHYAIEMITTMITKHGLSDHAKHIGAVRGGGVLGGDNRALPELGPDDLNELGAEIKRMFRKVCDDTAQLMKEQRVSLLVLARSLLHRSTLSAEEVRTIVVKYDGVITTLSPDKLLDLNFAVPKDALQRAGGANMETKLSERSPPAKAAY